MKKLLSVVLLGAFLASLGCSSSTSAPKPPTAPAKAPEDAKKTPP